MWRVPDSFVIRHFKQEIVMMSEEVVTRITNKVLWKSRILYNTTFHFSFSRLPFFSDAPKYGERPMLRDSVNHGISLFTIRHMLRASSIVVCSSVSYNQTECYSPSSYFSSYSGCEDGIATRLRAGWPGVRKKKNADSGKRLFSIPNFKTSHGAHPTSYCKDTGILSQRWSGRVVMLTIHSIYHVAPRLRRSAAILYSPYIFA